MDFPSFHERERENASNFLDDLDMAFLVLGRDEDAVKLKAFPLVLQEEAKSWFSGLPPEKKRSWEVLKDAFMAKFGAGNNPEELWWRLSSLRQSTLDSYQAYETHFLPCGPNGNSVYQKEREPLISSRKRSSWPDYLHLYRRR